MADETDPALGPTMRGVPRPTVGEWFGPRYRVKKLLGQGGMGAVYLASDEVLMSDVALKQLEHTGQASLEQLRDEVRLAQKVTHENVCRTFDLEEVEGKWLVKMEYVAGETLAARIARGPLPVDEAVRVARAVCAGLAAAHRQSVVHRDLKPHNILLEEKTARVVLTDFGLARADVLAGKTAEDISGTPEYMAPEQARGREVDGRADLYALGCVLYEMLTGAKLFRRDTAMATALAHAEDSPPPLPARFPEPLRRLVARLLEKDPARRPQTADEVAAALGPPRRRRAWLVVAAGLAVVAAVIALRPARRWQPDVKELVDYDENSDLPAISPDGKLIAYESNRDNAGSNRIYVQALDGSMTRALTPSDANAQAPRWSRDGKSILYVSGPGAYRISASGGAPELLAKGVGGVDDCGGTLLFIYAASPGCDGCMRLAIRDAAGERDLARFPADTRVQYPRCSRDGTQALYSRADVEADWYGILGYDLWIVPTGGGAPRQLTSDHGFNLGTFAADGASVIYSAIHDGKSNLWELSLDGKSAPVRLTSTFSTEYGPDVSADGRVLVYDIDTSSRQLFAQPVAGGAAQRLTAIRDWLLFPSVTPEGDTLIAESAIVSTRPEIVSVPVAGGDPVPIIAGRTPSLSPNGSEIIYSVGADLFALLRSDRTQRKVTSVPGRVLLTRSGGDGRVHMMVARPQAWEAWSAPATGGEASRDLPSPWMFYWPAPRGSWAIARRTDAEHGFQTAVLPRGAPIEDARVVTAALGVGAWSPDGEAYYSINFASEIHELTLASGADRIVAKDPLAADLTVSSDGKTLYLVRFIGRTRRAIITNLDDRRR